MRGRWVGRAAGLRVECHLVPDIVRQAPALAHAGTLVTPANELLAGTQRSYFPRGGPCPPPPPVGLETSSWGGMEVGPNMVYPMQCVDGAVHAWGGKVFREACRAALPPGGHCAVGSAVVTPACGQLAEHFRTVVHAVPPFRSDPRWRELLEETYASALRLAIGGALPAAQAWSLPWGSPPLPPPPAAVALPLLGAGARGADATEAAEVAASAVAAFDMRYYDASSPATVLLCVVEPAIATTLARQLDLRLTKG